MLLISNTHICMPKGCLIRGESSQQSFLLGVALHRISNRYSLLDWLASFHFGGNIRLERLLAGGFPERHQVIVVCWREMVKVHDRQNSPALIFPNSSAGRTRMLAPISLNLSPIRWQSPSVPSWMTRPLRLPSASLTSVEQIQSICQLIERGGFA